MSLPLGTGPSRIGPSGIGPSGIAFFTTRIIFFHEPEGRRNVKAVRASEGGVTVVDLDEPPGTGELLDMKSMSVCASDFTYIRFGSRMILGHELAGVREDGTAVVV